MATLSELSEKDIFREEILKIVEADRDELLEMKRVGRRKLAKAFIELRRPEHSVFSKKVGALLLSLFVDRETLRKSVFKQVFFNKNIEESILKRISVIL